MPAGVREIRRDLDFRERSLAALAKLTERYCVVWQSLRQPPAGAVSISRAG